MYYDTEDMRLKMILQEIIERIEDEVLETMSDCGDDWYAAAKVNDVLDIINEYV